MTRRKRGILILLATVVLLAGTEVVLNLVRGSQALVQVENQGIDPIENLVLVCGDSRATAYRVEPGETARLYITGRDAQTLQLTFQQRGNPLTNYQLPGFNANLMNREGFKLRILIRPKEIERFQDDAEPATPLGWLVQKAWNRIMYFLEEGVK
jgi:hypothetical protein